MKGLRSRLLLVVGSCVVGAGLLAYAGGRAGATVVAPPNDNFADAQVVDTSGGNMTVTGSNVGATTEPGEPAGPYGPYHTIWYSWTAAADGTAAVTTCGSNYDTLLGVYTGNAVDALTRVASSDDFCGSAAGVEFSATNGTTYMIQVDGYSGLTGDVTLNVYPHGLPHTLHVYTSGQGSVTSDTGGIACPGTCSDVYPGGTQVALTETPAAGFYFVGWSGDCTGVGPCSVTMNAERYVSAQFARRLLQVSTNGNGDGIVTSNPAGISCPSTCDSLFDDQASVDLTPTPSAGSHFDGWTGDCTGITVPCTLTMGSDKNVSATFTLDNPRTLSVQVSGTGSGAVTSDKPGINSCQSTCSHQYADGTSVTLSLSPGYDSSFVGWTGDCAAFGSNPCTLTMDGDKTVGAVFDRNPQTLTVTKTGLGTGTVTSDPAGIDCGGTCSTQFLYNAPVTLTAAPQGTSEWAGWGGDCSSAGMNLQCVVTMDQAHDVSAHFAQQGGDPGQLVGSVQFSQDCRSGIGVGIAYDGAGHLWVSCYASNPDLLRADPVTGQVDMTYNIAGGLGALAYDAGRNALWAGPGPGNTIKLIQLDGERNVVHTQDMFGVDYESIDDGIAYDSQDDSIYYSPDVSASITQYGADGTVIRSFGWHGHGCYNSGLAIGGDLLFEGSDGCSHVWVVNKNTFAPAFDFATSVGSRSSFRDEGLSCDNQTFAYEGKQVMWSKEAYSPNFAAAFLVPPGTCGTGGFHLTGSTLTGEVTKPNGDPAPGAPVQICDQDPNNDFGCIARFTNDSGVYTAINLPAGNFLVTANAPAGTNFTPGQGGPIDVSGVPGDLFTQDVQLGPAPGAPPEGTGVLSQVGVTGNGIPIVYWGDPLSLETHGCPNGTATYAVTVQGTVVRSGSMTETPSGSGDYVVHNIPALYPNHGDSQVAMTIQCPDSSSSNVGFAIYIDPSGIVYDAGTGAPIAGATVTLLRSSSDSADGPYFAVPNGSAVMSPANRTNPDTTGADGSFAWDVIAGYYEVQASAAGCSTGTTDPLQIPPPVTNLAIRLDCGHGTSAHNLSLSKESTGSGSVTSDPSGLDCGVTLTLCQKIYTGGTVTLTATPSAGSTFAGWSGDCTGAGTCTLTMDQDHAVTARFTAVPSYALSVSKSGSGTGTVSSDVGGIDCGATCAADYAGGTQVTLTATPAASSTFGGWSGACTGTGTCQVTMDQARNVTASFALRTETLGVTTSGNGAGTVNSSPAGVSCGSTCSASFDYGTPVTLTATPAASSTFTGWSGACAGTGACQVTMDQARDVTATFVLSTETLSVTTAGTGTGSVSSAPAGVSCGSTCSHGFDYGTQVTLTAAPGSGSTFTGWSGACSGTGACQVTMNQARDVTATFTKKPAAPKRCIVPKVIDKTLAAAKGAITKAGCTVGKITRAASKKVAKGKVISQSPAPGKHLKRGSKVNLVVSTGKKT